MLPLAFKLQDKSVLVLGAGRIGVGKARLLVDAGARVTIVARERLAPLPVGLDCFEERDYREDDLRGRALVVSATGDPVLNDLVVAQARERGVWLNVVDDPDRSDFFFTAVHRAGDVVVSVSTEGASPALAQYLRSVLRDALPEGLEGAARGLRAERLAMREGGTSTEGFDWSPRIRELLSATAASSPSR